MRLNFEFTEEQVEDLKALQQKTGTSNMKELFNNAFTMLEWAVDETLHGNEIAAVNEKNETYRIFVTPLLTRVAKTNQRVGAVQMEKGLDREPAVVG